MHFILSALSLLVAAIAFMLGGKRRKSIYLAHIVSLAVLVGAAAWAISQFSSHESPTQITSQIYGLLLGAALGLAAAIFGDDDQKWAIGFALATIGPLLLHFLSLNDQNQGASMLFAGAAGAALVLGSPVASITGVCLAGIYFCGVFGGKDRGPEIIYSGVAILALAAAVSSLLRSAWKSPYSGLVGVLVLLGAVNAVSTSIYRAGTPDLARVTAGAVLLGALIHWTFGADENPDALRLGVAALLWAVLMNFAFTFQHGLGVGLCLVAGAGSLLALGNGSTLGTIMPVLGLGAYRVFGFLHNPASGDTLRYNALIAIIIGAALPALLVDWWLAADIKRAWSRGAGTFLWAILIVVAILATFVIVEYEGFVYLLIGASVAGLLLRSKSGFGPLGLSAASWMCAVVLICSDWLVTATQLTRQEQTKWLGILLGITAIIALGLYFLTGKEIKEETV